MIQIMSEEVTKLESKNMVVTTEAPTVEKELNRTVGGKDYTLPFTRNNADSLDNVIAICTAIATSESTEKDKVDAEVVLARYFNSAYDLSIRAKLAPQLEAQVEGPGKQIDKAAKSLALALGISEAEAREIVVKGRKDRNLPV